LLVFSLVAQSTSMSVRDLLQRTNLQDIRKDFDAILVERVPGSKGNEQVQKYLIDSLSQHAGWVVTTDHFTGSTPRGELSFTNIIATYNAAYRKRIVFAAHFDSKFFEPPTSFLAATDSAVSCALLLDMVRTLSDLIVEKEEELRFGVQVIFFDGEEAFGEWTATDSLYGSRHLVEQWKTQPDILAEQGTMLQSIRSFILLDLIGAKDLNFVNFNSKTADVYQHFMAIEKRLRQLKVMKTQTNFFRNQVVDGRVEDDHIPFLENGVPTVHLIAVPFPEVWHKPTDDASAVDWNVVQDFAAILRVFAAEKLGV